jgi:RecA/RadA recombinase
MATRKALEEAKAAKAAEKAANKAAALTAGGLMDMMKDIAGKAGIKEAKSYKPVPTGLNVMDYYNARYFMNHESKQHELFTGLPTGKLIMMIGYTGTGKTTLAVQNAWSMVAPFQEGSIFHIDLENAWSIERTADITGVSVDTVKTKYFRTEPISLDKIYAFIKRVIFAKQERMKNPNDPIWVTNPHTGERMVTPTVFLIDTVAALQSEEVLSENEEMGKLMYEKGAQAGANNAFAQRLAGMIGEVNITIFAINHVRVGISDGGSPKPKRVQYLAADETVPGGTGFPQYADYFLHLRPTDSLTMKADEGFAIPGKIVKCSIIKSRLSYDGRQFDLVLTDNGFSNAWSNLQFLKSVKAIKGAGAHLFIEAPDGRATRKFAQRNWSEFYEGDQEFREVADARLEYELLGLVPQPGTAEEQEVMAGAEAVAGDLDEALTATE